MYFGMICHRFSQLSQVEAVVLGGSRAGSNYDNASDYDLYIYCTQIPPESERRKILEDTCSYMEIGNCFWELEDDCVLKNGIPIDILYRNLDSFIQDIASVVELGNAHNGYTTCMWHNLLQSQILFDRSGRLAQAKRRFAVPYPEKLRQNIIQKNLRLLTGNLPSYDVQIQKAIARHDLVSINHRTTAFLESYFDILFALNQMTHPGEKRIMSVLMAQADCLPEDFATILEQLFACLFTAPEHVPAILDQMIQNLRKILPPSDYDGQKRLCK